MDCSLPGSSVLDSPGKNTGVGSLSLLQWIFLTQGSNPGLQHYRQILYNLSHQGSPPGYKHTYKRTLTCRLTQLPPDLPLCRNLLGLPHRVVLQSHIKVILGTRRQQSLCPEHHVTCSLVDLGLPRWLSRKESICNEGDAGSILGQEDPL